MNGKGAERVEQSMTAIQGDPGYLTLDWLLLLVIVWYVEEGVTEKRKRL